MDNEYVGVVFKCTVYTNVVRVRHGSGYVKRKILITNYNVSD